MYDVLCVLEVAVSARAQGNPRMYPRDQLQVSLDVQHMPRKPYLQAILQVRQWCTHQHHQHIDIDQCDQWSQNSNWYANTDNFISGISRRFQKNLAIKIYNDTLFAK